MEEDWTDWPIMATPAEEDAIREQNEQRDRRAQVRRAQADADRSAVQQRRAAASSSIRLPDLPVQSAPLAGVEGDITAVAASQSAMETGV